MSSEELSGEGEGARCGKAAWKSASASMGWEGVGDGSWGCGSGCSCVGGDVGVVCAMGCVLGGDEICEGGCRVDCVVGLASEDAEEENQPIVNVL